MNPASGKPVILLAEDLEPDILIISRAFKDVYVPHQLVVVRSGEETIEYLLGHGQYADREQFPFPALLLLDVKMPRMDGFEVLKWLGAVPALHHLRVIVLTASDHIQDATEAYKLGASSFLVKPADFENTLQLARSLTKYWLVQSKLPLPFVPSLPPAPSQPPAVVKTKKPRRRNLKPRIYGPFSE
jgi:CheY-like chemotaxis protein